MSLSTWRRLSGRSLGFCASCLLFSWGGACSNVRDIGMGGPGGSPGAGAGDTMSGGYTTEGGGSAVGGQGSSATGGNAKVETGGIGGVVGDDPCPSVEELPSCASLEDVLSQPVDQGVEVSRAADFGDDVEFVALGGYAVLLERQDTTGPQRFGAVRIGDFGEVSPLVTFDTSLASPDLEAKDVVADNGVFPSLDALACESEVCQVWENRVESDVLAPSRLPPIPPEVKAERLTLSLDGKLCVFGAQLACLSADETWLVAPPLPPETGARFQTVLAGQEYEPTSLERPTFALTDAGVVLVLSRDGSHWMRQLGEEAEPIREVFRLYDTVVAVGRDGLWIPRLWEAPQVTCRTEGARAILPLDIRSRSYALILDNGSLLVRKHVAGSDSYRWCKSEASIEAPVVGLSVQTCGIDVVLFALSPERLFSALDEPRCAID